MNPSLVNEKEFFHYDNILACTSGITIKFPPPYYIWLQYDSQADKNGKLIIREGWENLVYKDGIFEQLRSSWIDQI